MIFRWKIGRLFREANADWGMGVVAGCQGGKPVRSIVNGPERPELDIAYARGYQHGVELAEDAKQRDLKTVIIPDKPIDNETWGLVLAEWLRP